MYREARMVKPFVPAILGRATVGHGIIRGQNVPQKGSVRNSSGEAGIKKGQGLSQGKKKKG